MKPRITEDTPTHAWCADCKAMVRWRYADMGCMPDHHVWVGVCAVCDGEDLSEEAPIAHDEDDGHDPMIPSGAHK